MKEKLCFQEIYLKNHSDCGRLHHCSLRHHACFICGIWRGNPCRAVAGNFSDISYKHGNGIVCSGGCHDFVCPFYDRKQIHIGTILYQVVYSVCVDLFANCHVYSEYLWLNLLIMLLGIVLFAAGTGLYASASLGRGSYEALTFALAEKNNWQVKTVRMVLDALMVIIGVLLGGKFGICTVVTILISGPIIQFVNGKAKKALRI